MNEPSRIDFLVYYRKQLQVIINKLDGQIEKAGGAGQADDEDVPEAPKELTNIEWLKDYFKNQNALDAFQACREFMNSISDAEKLVDERFYYSSRTLGNRFGMITISSYCINLYITPRLGVYEKLPQEAWDELHFGKSQGDRWDRFQLSSQRQVNIAAKYLRELLGLNPQPEKREPVHVVVEE